MTSTSLQATCLACKTVANESGTRNFEGFLSRTMKSDNFQMHICILVVYSALAYLMIHITRVSVYFNLKLQS